MPHSVLASSVPLLMKRRPTHAKALIVPSLYGPHHFAVNELSKAPPPCHEGDGSVQGGKWAMQRNLVSVG